MLEGTSLSTHTHQGQSCKPGTRSRCPGPSSILQSLAACVRSSLVGHSTYSGMNCTVPRLLQRSGLSRRVKLREIFVISKCCWGYTLQATMPSKINKGPERKGLLKTVRLFQLLSLLENSKAKASLKQHRELIVRSQQVTQSTGIEDGTSHLQVTHLQPFAVSGGKKLLPSEGHSAKQAGCLTTAVQSHKPAWYYCPTHSTLPGSSHGHSIILWMAWSSKGHQAHTAAFCLTQWQAWSPTEK